jgi:electron transfer flavoprotein alpha subunit
LLPGTTNSLEGEYIEESIELSEENVNTKVLEVVKETGKINLQDADFIFSGGRGIGCLENFNMLEELASILNDAVGALKSSC